MGTMQTIKASGSFRIFIRRMLPGPWTSLFLLILISSVVISTDSERVKRQLTRHDASKWTNKTVPYYFNTSDPAYWALVELAMAQISSQTCVKFLHDTDPTPKNRLQILNEGRCAAFVGMVRTDQPLWLSGGCRTVSTFFN